jgi:diguanylate cyclase (GGDEF)-like protein
MACSVPVAWLRAREGDRGARFMLVGWLFYAAGALTMAAMLRGWVEPTLLVRWIYPLAAMAEMTAWMGVLAHRAQLLQRQAERSRAEGDTLRRLAHTDALTGLPNRRGLQERLHQVLPAAGPGRLVALYLLDLDGFKPVNDQHGHDVGDALLVAVGQRLKSPLRAGDTVSRLGGDEFVVLAEGLPSEAAARHVADKLLAAVNTPFNVGGRQVRVGLTVGYALAPLDGSSADELLKRADAAMYTGKRGGGLRIERGGRGGSTTLAELTA